MPSNREAENTAYGASGKSGVRSAKHSLVRGQPPELPAYRHPDDVHFLVWCVYCRRYHWHGLLPGHRTAHCPDQGTPHRATGYVLIDAGPASPDLLRDARRKRPRGPEGMETHHD
jgi:hypothetical protein